jgi:transcriptional regulator with XRE-family HTH domain
LKINLKKIRKRRKMSLMQLSKKTEIAHGYLSELESGKYNNPGAIVICKLMKVLNCTFDELIDCEVDEDGRKDIHS